MYKYNNLVFSYITFRPLPTNHYTTWVKSHVSFFSGFLAFNQNAFMQLNYSPLQFVCF